MKSERGFSYDPDAVEAAENGTLKLETETEVLLNQDGVQITGSDEVPTATSGFVAVEETKPELDWNPHAPEAGDPAANLEGAVCSQVLEAIKDAKGEPDQPADFQDLVSTAEALAAVGEAASAAAQAVGQVADAAAEMKRKMALVAEKAKQKLVRELRKADPKHKKTCSICHTRVPLEVIGAGKNDACDACLATI